MTTLKIDTVHFRENVKVPNSPDMTQTVGGARHRDIAFVPTPYGLEMSRGGDASLVPWGGVRQIVYERPASGDTKPETPSAKAAAK